jgi:hypothetical protein
MPDPLANVMGLAGSTGYPTGEEDLSIVPALPGDGLPLSNSLALPNAGV